MSDYPVETKNPRPIWRRGLLMILMALAFQLTSTLLMCLALIQFVLFVLGAAPNVRLITLGHQLGRYLSQIADYVSFRVNEAPFPWSDWPADN